MSVAGEIEQRNSFGEVGFISVSMPSDLALAAVLFLTPLVRHFFEEGGVDQPVELVDVHRVNAIAQSLVFRLKSLYRFLVFAAFFGVAGVECVSYPFQHFVIKFQPTEQFGELHFDDFFADIFAPTGGGPPLAFVSIAGAVVIDVSLLLYLAHHCAAAGMATHQTSESEIAFALLGAPGIASVHHGLHPLPQVCGHNGLVAALIGLTIPIEASGIDTVSQYRCDCTFWNAAAAFAEYEASRLRFSRYLLRGHVAPCIRFKHLADDRCGRFVWHDDLTAVLPRHISIAERGV